MENISTSAQSVIKTARSYTTWGYIFQSRVRIRKIFLEKVIFKLKPKGGVRGERNPEDKLTSKMTSMAKYV